MFSIRDAADEVPVQRQALEVVPLGDRQQASAGFCHGFQSELQVMFYAGGGGGGEER